MSVTQRTTAVMYSALERKLEKARQDRDTLAEESAHEAQRTRVAAQAYERARRELQTRTAEAKTATSAARLLRKELGATRAELLGLQEQHHAALAHTQTLQAKLHQQGVELQEHRAQELGTLRDAVGKAARTPLRDQTRQRRSLSASRAPAAAAAARKTPAAAAAAAAEARAAAARTRLETLLAASRDDAAALQREVEVLREQNGTCGRELEKCNEDKDKYVQLLMTAGGSAAAAVASGGGGGCEGSVSLQCLNVLLGAAQQSLLGRALPAEDEMARLAATLRSYSTAWSPGGVEHIPVADLVACDPASLAKHLTLEEHRLASVRRMLELYTDQEKGRQI